MRKYPQKNRRERSLRKKGKQTIVYGARAEEGIKPRMMLLSASTST